MLARALTERRAVLHGPLEMRDAADDVDALVEGAGQVREAVRRAEEPVLRKGDELEVEVGGDGAPDLEERVDADQPRVGGVDVAADREEAHRHRPVAVGERAVADLLEGRDRAEFAPELDALEQRPGRVDPRQAVGQRCVHVEVRVDERRGDEVAGGVDAPAGFGVEAADGGDRSPVMPMSATVPSGSVPPLTRISNAIRPPVAALRRKVDDPRRGVERPAAYGPSGRRAVGSGARSDRAPWPSRPQAAQNRAEGGTEILGGQAGAGFGARGAVEPDRGARGLEAGSAWARSPAAKPARTSPDPAVASQGGALALIARRPSGAAMAVSGPLRMTIAPRAAPRRRGRGRAWAGRRGPGRAARTRPRAA